ncbi:MAG: histidinol dehydrogenase [Acidimicrobiia bacterium]|nr:histidinol dehydrogenase [Acidimicrobiia bacterium]
MLVRLDVRDARADLGVRLGLTSVGTIGPDPVADTVRSIIETVRTQGDAALREYTRQFDHATIDEIRVPRSEWEAAAALTPPEVRAALELAGRRIADYHQRQVSVPPTSFEADGLTVTEAIRPVDRAGLYVPGGRAAYPSTVLMTAIPARIAGVPERVLCVPPDRDGVIPAVTLAAALLADVTEVYRVGGAQAIAAMAYGTESIPAVDVIVGPGNAYVDAAKRQVAGAGVVGIDGPAGPSELVVVADSGADPLQVALDLAAQAEHGPGGTAMVVAWDPNVLDAVVDALTGYLGTAERADEIRSTLSTGGRAVLVRDVEQAIEVANHVAPEHLELLIDHAAEMVPTVRHAGAVFIDAPTAIGDYVSGANHVLPTGRAARFASALRVDDFRTHMHIIRATPDGLAAVGPAAATLADAEGLAAHAASVRRRMRS